MEIDPDGDAAAQARYWAVVERSLDGDDVADAILRQVDERRHGAERARVLALGVPDWAPVGVSSPESVEAVLYCWVEGTDVETRLDLPRELDKSESLRALVEACRNYRAAPPGRPGHAIDPEYQAAMMTVRSLGGVGYGSLGRQELLPLNVLIEAAIATLEEMLRS